MMFTDGQTGGHLDQDQRFRHLSLRHRNNADLKHALHILQSISPRPLRVSNYPSLGETNVAKLVISKF